MKTKSILRKLMNVSLCVLAATQILTSCKKDDDPEPSLEISTTTLSVSKGGGIEDLYITSNVGWEISSSQSWVTVSPSKGEGNAMVEISIEKNTTTDSRECTVKIGSTNGSINRQLRISQEGADVTLEVGKVSIDAPKEGFSESITVLSNTKWSVGSYPSWIIVSPTQGEGDGSVSISVMENTTFESRNSVINVTTLKGGLTKQIRVSQEAADVELSVDLHEVVLGATADSKQEVSINCNTSWSISGFPEWLVSSAQSGNKGSIITLTALTDNNTAFERSARLSVKANNKEVEFIVKQRAGRAGVTVTPHDVVALYNELCFEWKATGNISYFYYDVISENEINRMTDNGLVAQLCSGEKRIYEDGWIAFPTGLKENTTYYICSIAYDKDDKQGELIKTKVTTPGYKGLNADAWASVAYSVNNYILDWYYVDFRFTKQAYCHKYHAIFGTDISEKDPITQRSLYAFQINYYKKYGVKHWFAENRSLKIYLDYPNSDSFSEIHCNINPYAVAYSWGIFENGELSSDVVGGFCEPGLNESPNRSARNQALMKNNVSNHNQSESLKLSDLRKSINKAKR